MALSDFFGSWTLDFDYSVAHGNFLKNLPEARREEQRGGQVILNADTIQLINPRGQQPPRPYTIKEETDTETVLAVPPMEINIQAAEGGRMRFAMTPPGAPAAMDFYFARD